MKGRVLAALGAMAVAGMIFGQHGGESPGASYDPGVATLPTTAAPTRAPVATPTPPERPLPVPQEVKRLLEQQREGSH